MKDDTISRQAALDAIKKLEKPAPTAQHLSAIFDCEDTIKALPSAQPGWIPTSEKLPEEDTPVLICSTEEDKFYHSVAVGWYCGGEWHCWDDRYGKGDVNAWMPLPTPYREGGQDNGTD